MLQLIAGQHLGNPKKRQIERDKKLYPAMKFNVKFTQMSTESSLSQNGRFEAKCRSVNDTWKIMSAFEILKLKNLTVGATMKSLVTFANDVY